MIKILLASILALISSGITADSSSKDVYDLISKNVMRIRIIKRHLDPDTGKSSFLLPPDKLYSEGIGFHIGNGHIITARHVINSIRKGDRSLFLDITTHTGERIRKAKIGKCDSVTSLKSPDVCLLKTNFKGEGIKLPKEFFLSAVKGKSYGVLELTEEGIPNKVIRKGEYIRKFTVTKKINMKENNGLELYETSIPTVGGYSGSPVFDVKSGKLLGMTTTVATRTKKKSGRVVSKKQNALVIPVKTIRKYLNSKNWKYEEIPRGWFY